ncbi:extracellular triacylglycerol lipase precursor [Crucibulum laeve]|uniref:Carboxylic ester hydrolase n=1 Tax=Crucibulum laeve TaxID=68775 RepID=A0A5C3LF95_9AGAR|nr:extracellular triacylglycerol lipase precursor [Crucibulum laeve]
MLLPIAFTFGLLASVAAAPQVKIGKTTFTGRDVTLLKQDFFGGIPFAEPPLGNLRLKPPVLKTRLDVSTFDASNFGPGCLQASTSVGAVSEDCLTINVFRPSGLPANAKLPVLFWTYGGSFTSGAATIYNGSAIVAQSVARGTPLIYVNFNYRLGPLGFPQGQESDDQGALNLGIKDDMAALEWVQHNIGFFGGDKNKVTIFGQSAGAIINAIIYLNPSRINKLARGAIFESGSAATFPTFNAAHNQVDWENFVAGVPSCASQATSGKTFDCLKQANTTEIFSGLKNGLANVPGAFGYGPNFDGPHGVFPEVPSKLFAKGQFARLPFITGTNLDEGTIFTPENINSENLVEQLVFASLAPSLTTTAELNDTVVKLLQLYPDIPALGSPFNTGNETFGLPAEFKQIAALQGDLGFHSQRRAFIRTASNAGVKTFSYLFTQPQPNGNPADGVAHGSEVLFVYGAPQDRSAPALQLSALMVDYWVSFATSLTPNDGHGVPRPQWAQYTPHNQVLMEFNAANTTLIADDYRKTQIDFINSRPLVLRHRRAL